MAEVDVRASGDFDEASLEFFVHHVSIVGLLRASLLLIALSGLRASAVLGSSYCFNLGVIQKNESLAHGWQKDNHLGLRTASLM